MGALGKTLVPCPGLSPSCRPELRYHPAPFFSESEKRDGEEKGGSFGTFSARWDIELRALSPPRPWSIYIRSGRVAIVLIF